MDEVTRIENELRRAMDELACIDSHDPIGLALATGLVDILEERLRRLTRDRMATALPQVS